MNRLVLEGLGCHPKCSCRCAMVSRSRAILASLTCISEHDNLLKLFHGGLLIPKVIQAFRHSKSGGQLTSLRPSFAVLGFRPVAINTWSKPSIVYVSPDSFFRCMVKVPSSFLTIFSGLHSGCKLSPLPSYCSVMYCLHSSSKPRSG